jgi:hypothetical protein
MRDYQNDEIKEREMGRACSAREGDKRRAQFVGKPEGKRP